MTAQNREQRRALERATRRTKEAGDPATALELEELRAVRTGAYALMQVLVSRMGATEAEPIHIARGEWQALPPLERLKVKRDATTDDFTLWIEHRESPTPA